MFIFSFFDAGKGDDGRHSVEIFIRELFFANVKMKRIIINTKILWFSERIEISVYEVLGSNRTFRQSHPPKDIHFHVTRF